MESVIDKLTTSFLALSIKPSKSIVKILLQFLNWCRLGVHFIKVSEIKLNCQQFSQNSYDNFFSQTLLPLAFHFYYCLS